MKQVKTFIEDQKANLVFLLVGIALSCVFKIQVKEPSLMGFQPLVTAIWIWFLAGVSKNIYFSLNRN